jgi:DNA-binding protein YbaB
VIEQSSRDLVEEMRWQLGKIRDRQAANEELLGKLDEAKGELAALEAKVSSPDGRVTVVAGSGGIVRSVELAENAMNTNAKTLTATINATVKAAIAEATGKQLEIVRARVGDVEPVQVLGPQAKFASFGVPASEEAVPSQDRSQR